MAQLRSPSLIVKPFSSSPPPVRRLNTNQRMVLSNKKLKQKHRLFRAESLAAGEAPDEGSTAHPEAATDKQLKSSSFCNNIKRMKGGGKTNKNENNQQHSEETQKENVESDNGEEEDKGKKRKRDDGEVIEPVKQLSKRQKKKEKLKKKREKEKEKKNEKREKKEARLIAGGEEKKIVGESEQNPKKVYVGGIPYYSTEDDIRSFFEGCGTVTDVDCMKFPESGKFRGIAILTFKTEAAAKRALDLDGSDMGGFYLKIQPYKTSRKQKEDFTPEVVEGYNRIYAGNLSWDVTEDELRKLLADCNISAIRWGMDKETGDFKGYAHVDFSDSASLLRALKLDQHLVCGRPVRIRCAVSKKSGNNISTNKDIGYSKAQENQGSNKAHANKGSDKSMHDSTSQLDVVYKADDDMGDETKKKKKKNKRRTCYQCGVPGHLATDCTQKKAVDSLDANS